MYEEFFGLSRRPFAATVRHDLFFAAGPFEAARQTLVRCIGRGEGPALLIGPAGTGKTMLCQMVAKHFHDTFRVVVLDDGQVDTRRVLMQSIMFGLGQPYRDMDEGELRLGMIDYLTSSEDCPRGMLLIIDEADALPLRLLDEIRAITNLIRNGEPRVRLLLCGGSSMEERFTSPELDSFNQRIAARCYTETMSRSETAGYVAHQIAVVGGSTESPFDDDAIRSLYDATEGVPRLVNQVCDHAMMLATEQGTRHIGPVIIQEAWADLQQLPAPWGMTDEPTESTTIEAGESMVEFGALDDDEPAIAEHSFDEPLVNAVVPAEDNGPVMLRLVTEHDDDEPVWSPFEQNDLDLMAEDTSDALDTQQSGSLEAIIAPMLPVASDTLIDIVEPDSLVDEPIELASEETSEHVAASIFGDGYTDEEVIIEHHSTIESLERIIGRAIPRVASLEGKQIAAVLEVEVRATIITESPQTVIEHVPLTDEVEQPVEEPVVLDTVNDPLQASDEQIVAADSSDDLLGTTQLFVDSDPVLPYQGLDWRALIAGGTKGVDVQMSDAGEPVEIKSRTSPNAPLDDRDLILIDSADPVFPEALESPTGNLPSEKYGRLFARLRHG